MKHIQKRFKFQKRHPSYNPDINKSISPINEFNSDLSKGVEDHWASLITTNNYMIAGTIHNINGSVFVIPIPDLALIYFHCAQQYCSKIDSAKKSLLSKLNINGSLSDTAINEIYEFYHLTFGFSIFLFTSIESFINQKIPDNYIYKNELKNKTEYFNSSQVQRSIDLKTKLTVILPEILNKNFFSKQTPLNQRIWKLKEFRDSIIHSKHSDNPYDYRNIITTSLNFKYNETLNSVASLFNFYEKNCIIECDCGEDF